MSQIRAIVSCPLFTGLEPARVLNIFRDLHYRVKSYNKNNIIVQAGEDCNNLHIKLEGSVKGEMTDYSGKTIKIEDIETWPI